MYVKFVRGTQAKYDAGIATYSADGSIYFAEDSQVIYNNGIAYGLSSEAAEKIQNIEDGIVDISGYEDDPAGTPEGKTALEKWAENPVVNAANVTITDAGQKYTSTNVEDALQEIAGNIDKAKIVNNDVITVGTPTASGTPLSVTVDGVTIDKASNALKSVVKLGYNTTSKEIELQDKNGTKLSSVAASDIVGSGIVDEQNTSYDETTGILTITWIGGETTEVDLQKLFDIDDIVIANTSRDYLSFDLTDPAVETGQASLKVKLAEVSYTPTQGASAATLTVDTTNGKLLDASNAISKISDYVADVLANANTNLAVTAEGDDYVDARVDADTDNKHVIVDANVTTLTGTKGTAGTYNATTGAQTTAPVNGTLSGTANSLVDAADVASKVKNYVDGQVAIEAARSDAKNKADIAALDATVGSTTVDTGKHVAVQVVETDGKLTGLTVTENDIASAQALTDEIARAKAAETEIANKVGLTGNEGSRVYTPTTNYPGTANTVKDNMQAIDTQVKANENAIEALAQDIEQLEGDLQINVNGETSNFTDGTATVEVDGTKVKLNKAAAQANTLLNPASGGRTAGEIKYGDNVTASIQKLEAQLLWYEA